MSPIQHLLDARLREIGTEINSLYPLADHDVRLETFRVKEEKENKRSYHHISSPAKSDWLHDDAKLDLYDDTIPFRQIGSTGRNWRTESSEFVGFDFDIPERKSGTASDNLDRVRSELSKLPYVEVRHSKSGVGLHARVILEGTVAKSSGHHTANAEAVLEHLIQETGLPLNDWVDCKGGNLWHWVNPSLAKPKSFQLLSEATERLQFTAAPFEEKTVVRDDFTLTPLQRCLIVDCSMKESGHVYNSHGTRVHAGLGKWGQKSTLQGGNTDPATPNVYVDFPSSTTMTITRYGHPDSKETIHLRLRFDDVCIGHRLATDGKSYTTDAATYKRIFTAFGVSVPDVPDHHGEPRIVTMTRLSPGCVRITIPRHGKSDHVDGFTSKPDDRKQSATVRFGEAAPDVTELQEHTVRYTIRPDIEGIRGNQYYLADSTATFRPVGEKEVARHIDLKGLDVNETLDTLVCNPIKIVAKHFAPPTLVGNEWNVLGCQVPEGVPGDFSTYQQIIDHAGQFLQSGIDRCSWCRRHDVDGAKWLKYWFAAVRQDPYEPLPGLGLYSFEHGTGKTSLREALRHTFGSQYVVDGAKELDEKWSGHLVNAVVVSYEEVNLNRPESVSKLKDLITSRTLSVRKMQTDSFSIRNATHHIHTGQNPEYAPVEPGDRRWTIFDELEKPTSKVSSVYMERQLEAERLAWLYELEHTEIPPIDRDMDFRLPTLTSDLKLKIMDGTTTVPPNLRPLREAITEVLADPILNGVKPGELATLPEIKKLNPRSRDIGTVLRGEGWRERSRKFYRPQPQLGA